MIVKLFKYIFFVSLRKVVVVFLFVWFYVMFCVFLLKFGLSLYFCFIFNLDNCDIEKDWFGLSGFFVFVIVVLGLIYCFVLIVMVVCYWKIFGIVCLYVWRINV